METEARNALHYFPVTGNSEGELLAALGATTSQNLAAVGGGHSLAETVLLGALTLLGLISADHVGHFLSYFSTILDGAQHRSWHRKLTGQGPAKMNYIV